MADLTQVRYALGAADVSTLFDRAENFALLLNDGPVTAEWVEKYEPPAYDEYSSTEVWFVFGIGDQLFKVSGWAGSHYGVDWDGYTVREVKPKPVQRVEYVAV